MRKTERYVGAVSLAFAVLLALVQVAAPAPLPTGNRVLVFGAVLLALVGAVLIVRSITRRQRDSGPGRD